ncbi:MAG: acyl-CoA synthetase [Sphingomonadaceae bacterium]|uniref:acyl-CoA synthetase n=1 Tax=Thermaurantiacus sp. TaxID=2820283 RepID=UPI00298EDC32|nr:acyl-CoA synthetase [Thermaurantiacus sp.]MCS6987865.1 acyl-CoA synthetase [Sphingomonadaceae bacterium]MDW8414915.1 acyl-CoA synthetase [Thermaurantiacus sp.]
MHPFRHAETQPEKPAIVMGGSGETLTYAGLEARSNRMAQLFRHLGLKRGDTVAYFLLNGIDYLPLCWAAQRSGLIFTCISTKLTADEAGYIVRDCGAKLLVASAELGAVARELPAVPNRLAVGGAIDGFTPLEDALAPHPETRIADESPGRDMLYSSGTTGRPKGVIGPLPEGPIDQPDPLLMLVTNLYGFGPDTIYLSPAPLYHAAPLRYCMAVHRAGGTVIVMEKFDAERFLALIERHRVTHSQVVPTMFVRMLKLPEDVRRRYDLSSIRAIIHAAAPCPIEVKERMIEWLGPRIYEYYSATEGAGFTAIGPEEWLRKKGSVGKALLGEIRIVDEQGNLLPPGREGRIYFHGGPPVQYHNDPQKTAEVTGPHGTTFGDIGYVDEDGYLFLTDRASYMIISGGVNVYPQETENVLIMHPKVADVAVIGVPDEELGEAVKAVVQPRDWADAGPELAAELIAYCRARLSPIKCPKSVDFDPELPRHDTGKLYKRLLKERYWPRKTERAA